MQNCPVCCKPLKIEKFIAFCNDDDGAWRYVGKDCWRRIRQSGKLGYKQERYNGPRWFAKRQDAVEQLPQD